MIKSLALESGLGLWKLGIGLSLLLVLAPGLGYGQDSSKSSGGIPKKVAPAAKKVAQPVAKKGTEVNSEESQGPETPAGHYEIFKDDRAEEALGKLKSVGKDCPPKIVSDIRSMAAGQIPVDSETIQKFVSGMANRLTDKSNINAVVSPPANLLPTSPAARAVAVTVDNLIDPLLSAKALKNTSFLNAYNQELLATLPQLLNNHLVSRIQAAIVLAQTGSAQNLPIFLAQLKDPKQTIWVKLWATRGITNIVDGGRSADSALSATDASNAAKAVVDYLKAEKELPWPAQLRALETLGALRQPGLPSSPQKAEIAATAMQFLADPDARLEVRVKAAWAMGMFQVAPRSQNITFR